MTDAIRKAKDNRGYVFLFFIVMAVACIFSFIGLISSSSRASQQAGLEMDTLYLRELTTQTIGHFQTGISSQFSQLKTSAASIQEEDLKNEESLAAYLARILDYNNFNFFALVDEDGKYYCREGVFPAASKISFLGPLLEGQADLLSYNETILGEDMILIGEPIEPVSFGEERLVGVLAGLDVDVLNSQLTLKREDAKTYSSMIDRTGKYIVNNSYNNDLSQGTNILSKLEKYATFLPGYSLEEVSGDLRNNEAGLAAYTVDGQKQYMYYAPIRGTDWYLLTIIPYEVVNSIISDLIGSLNRNVVVMMIIILGLLSGLFLFFYLHMSRDERRLRLANAAAQEARVKAENASLAKSEFLSRMSHEIRTPMNGIIGMGTIARQNIGNPARVEECLKKQELSSQHLLALINDILDMSKIESGKIELRNSPFDLQAVLEGLVNIYDAQAVTKGIDFEAVLTEKAGEPLMGDSLRLNQILSNLLSNAVKFTPPGGTVRLTASDVYETKEELRLRFEVSDTGCGIAEENFDKVFESFEQENADVTSNYGGTGLGLAIVRRFTELMGGRVWIQSRLGEGSTFFVELSFHKAGEQPGVKGREDSVPDALHHPEDYDFHGKTILLAEDNAINREIACELLAATGAETEAAQNGKEAVALFENSEPGHFSLILMDVQMPVMNGYEATGKIRKLNRADAKTVPIFAMTANAFAEDEEKSRLAGMDSHITKPLDVKILYSQINRFLTQRGGQQTKDGGKGN